MIGRLLVLVVAALIAIVVVKIVFVVALVGVAMYATWYAYRFLSALVAAPSPRRLRSVRPLVQPRVSVNRMVGSDRVRPAR